RKDVTLRKLDIKVETVNREPLTLHADREEDTASVSTATRGRRGHRPGDWLGNCHLGWPGNCHLGWELSPGMDGELSPGMGIVTWDGRDGTWDGQDGNCHPGWPGWDLGWELSPGMDGELSPGMGIVTMGWMGNSHLGWPGWELSPGIDGELSPGMARMEPGMGIVTWNGRDGNCHPGWPGWDLGWELSPWDGRDGTWDGNCHHGMDGELSPGMPRMEPGMGIVTMGWMGNCHLGWELSPGMARMGIVTMGWPGWDLGWELSPGMDGELSPGMPRMEPGMGIVTMGWMGIVTWDGNCHLGWELSPGMARMGIVTMGWAGMGPGMGIVTWDGRDGNCHPGWPGWDLGWELSPGMAGMGPGMGIVTWDRRGIVTWDGRDGTWDGNCHHGMDQELLAGVGRAGGTWDGGNVPALESLGFFPLQRSPCGFNGILGIAPGPVPDPTDSPSLGVPNSTLGPPSRATPSHHGMALKVPPRPSHPSFKDDVDLKQDLRCDTIDTREEYELKGGKRGADPEFFLFPLEWVENSWDFRRGELDLLGWRGNFGNVQLGSPGPGMRSQGNGWRCSGEGFGMDFREKSGGDGPQKFQERLDKAPKGQGGTLDLDGLGLSCRLPGNPEGIPRNPHPPFPPPPTSPKANPKIPKTRRTFPPNFSPSQDPTNGYYNVRAHEDRPASRSVLYGDYRAPGPGRFEARPPSRLSHSSGYAQLSSYPRGGPEFPPEAAAAPGTAAGDTASQLSYENYAGGGGGAFPGGAAFPPYRLGFAAAAAGLERGAYEAYEAVGKFGGAARFSYTSQHSDYGQRFQQRMQTHV
ncbi:hypothetical protein DV515_00019142, partial [Chloebia gouldiae]